MARWAWRCSPTPHELREEVRARSKGVTVSPIGGPGAAAADTGSPVAEGEDRRESQNDCNGVAVVGMEGAAGLEEGRRPRGISNTGVAALLTAVAKADPSGDIIQALQR